MSNKPVYLCAGPDAGVISKEEAHALGLPADAVGHRRRGVKKEITKTSGDVSVDEAGNVVTTEPVIEVVYEKCGNNLTALIDAVPANGFEYGVICPKCGGVTKVKKMPEVKVEENELG